MAKYLVKVSYNSDGINNSSKDSVLNRKKKVEELIASMGGKMESSYYAFGDYGVYCISDIADDITAADLKLAINNSGLVTCLTTILISPEDIAMTKNKVVH